MHLVLPLFLLFYLIGVVLLVFIIVIHKYNYKPLVLMTATPHSLIFILAIWAM
jgi:hypothetical protein